jgi:hypothetical protein
MKSPETNSGSEQPLKNKYQGKADTEGYVFINDFAIAETSHQSKSIAGLADGDEGTEEWNLGKDLRVRGNSSNYPDTKIHIDDLDEFVRRIKNHFEE